MKTYSVLYAEDVPHYAFGEIEARNDRAAINKARKIDPDTFGSYEPDWEGCVCKRIVHIEASDGTVIAEAIPLDNYHLMRDVDSTMVDAAPLMAHALSAVYEVIREHGLGDDDRQSEGVVSLIVKALTAAGRAP